MNDEFKDRVKGSVRLSDFVIGCGVKLSGGPVEWKGLCPFHQEKTPSFTVNDEKRLWHCFGACQAGGDVFEFVMRLKGLDFVGALKHTANAVGIALPERLYQPRGAEARAAERSAFDPSKYRPLVVGGKVWRYLTEERKLDADLLVDYSVGETADGEAYSLAYKWQPPGWKPADGKARFEFCKVVKVDRPGGKKVEWRDPKGGRNILFGMLTVKPEDRELVICEGELDAISWAQYGYAAVSVPGGAGALGWIELCWDWLQRFEKVHVSFDEDAAGRKKVVEIVTRLGMARTDMVRLPERADGGRYKDANECLKAGVGAEAMRGSVEGAEIVRPAALKDIWDFEEEIWQKFHPDGKEQLGLLLPWGNRHGSSLPFRFRYGEVSVWTGYNKHGKSEMLNHVVVDLCWQGERALICSLEVAAPETYRKLVRMVFARRDVCGKEERSDFAEKYLRPLSDKVWVYDHVGNAGLTDVMNVMLYAYQRYGCRQFVLDSLMKFQGLDGEGQEQWNRQRDLMNQLTEFAGRYRVHVHLVCHSKKPDKQGEAKIPRRYDISGSAYLSNQPNNVLVVWRNRAKQDKLEVIFQQLEERWVFERGGADMPVWPRLQGGPPAKSAPAWLWEKWNAMMEFLRGMPEELKDTFSKEVLKPDTYFIVDAQRGGDGDCPARNLWFHYDSLQFIEASPWDGRLREGDARARPVEYAAKKLERMDEEL